MPPDSPLSSRKPLICPSVPCRGQDLLRFKGNTVSLCFYSSDGLCFQERDVSASISEMESWQEPDTTLRPAAHSEALLPDTLSLLAHSRAICAIGDDFTLAPKEKWGGTPRRGRAWALGPDHLDLNPPSATLELCDLKEVTYPLCALTSTSE